MAIELPQLPFSPDALEPHMSRRTLEFHHDKHHKTYVETLNQLIGAGWTWLTKDKRGRLKVRPMSNAGNPLIELYEIPLLVCDVWEHAYYLDYQNERPKYLENFWQVVNWNFVESNLEQETERPSRPVGRSKAASSRSQTTHARSP